AGLSTAPTPAQVSLGRDFERRRDRPFGQGPASRIRTRIRFWEPPGFLGSRRKTIRPRRKGRADRRHARKDVSLEAPRIFRLKASNYAPWLLLSGTRLP